jgi:hypothetical protein
MEVVRVELVDLAPVAELREEVLVADALAAGHRAVGREVVLEALLVGGEGRRRRLPRRRRRLPRRLGPGAQAIDRRLVEARHRAELAATREQCVRRGRDERVALRGGHDQRHEVGGVGAVGLGLRDRGPQSCGDQGRVLVGRVEHERGVVAGREPRGVGAEQLGRLDQLAGVGDRDERSRAQLLIRGRGRHLVSWGNGAYRRCHRHAPRAA